jgi:hypothetical protein
MDQLKALAAGLLSEWIQERAEFEGQKIHDQAKWDTGVGKIIDGVFDLLAAVRFDVSKLAPRLMALMRGRR